MAFLKKLASKIAKDTKDAVAEEVKKTGGDVKQYVRESLKEAAPIIIAFGIGLAVGIIFKRPVSTSAPITINITGGSTTWQ